MRCRLRFWRSGLYGNLAGPWIFRGENGLPRMGAIDVALEPGFAEADQARAAACLKAFESYCAVTESVRAGIDVRVAVSQQASAGN